MLPLRYFFLLGTYFYCLLLRRVLCQPGNEFDPRYGAPPSPVPPVVNPNYVAPGFTTTFPSTPTTPIRVTAQPTPQIVTNMPQPSTPTRATGSTFSATSTAPTVPSSVSPSSVTAGSTTSEVGSNPPTSPLSTVATTTASAFTTSTAFVTTQTFSSRSSSPTMLTGQTTLTPTQGVSMTSSTRQFQESTTNASPTTRPPISSFQSSTMGGGPSTTSFTPPPTIQPGVENVTSTTRVLGSTETVTTTFATPVSSYTGTERPPATTTTRAGPVTTNEYHNGVKGRPYVVCNADGITFTAATWFPFTGRVYTRGHRDDVRCSHAFVTEVRAVNQTFDYKACGMVIAHNESQQGTMYSVEVIMEFSTTVFNEHTVQSFVTQCMSQKIAYETPELPTRVEEALEEIKIVPVQVEQQARMPQCQMRIVPESEEDGDHAHRYGPSDRNPISNAVIGQQLRIEWSLSPVSDAFGFLIKNCTVLDEISGKRIQVIDDKGCSTDINILGHPHYDVYHDLSVVHWHAFNVPDNSRLSITCACAVCSDLTSTDDGSTGCHDLPTPPFCPKVDKVDFDVQNALFLDFQRNFLAQKLVDQFSVETAVRVFDKKEDPEKDPNLRQLLQQDEENLKLRRDNNRKQHTRPKDERQFSDASNTICLTKTVFTLIVTFLVAFFLSTTGLCLTTLFCRARLWNQRRVLHEHAGARRHKPQLEHRVSSLPSSTSTSNCGSAYASALSLLVGAPKSRLCQQTEALYSRTHFER